MVRSTTKFKNPWFLSYHLLTFTSVQHGIRTGRSTFTALQSILCQIYTGLNEGKHAAGINVDLSKAFEVVSLDLLLFKLEKYRDRGPALSLLISYFSDMEQLVEIRHITWG